MLGWTYLLSIVPVGAKETSTETIDTKFLILWGCFHSCEPDPADDIGHLSSILTYREACSSFIIESQLFNVCDDFFAARLSQASKPDVCMAPLNNERMV